MNKKMGILLAVMGLYAFCCLEMGKVSSGQDFSEQKLVIIPQDKEHNSVIKWDTQESLRDAFQGKNTPQDCRQDAEGQLVETVQTRSYLPLSDKVSLNNDESDSFAAVDMRKKVQKPTR